MKLIEQYPLAKSRPSLRRKQYTICLHRQAKSRAEQGRHGGKGRSPWDRGDDASDGVDGHDGKTRRATRCGYDRLKGACTGY